MGKARRPEHRLAKQMAAVIRLPQTSKWAKLSNAERLQSNPRHSGDDRAKCENQPPVRQPNHISRTREYLTSDEVERMIRAARHGGSRLAERDSFADHDGLRHGP